MLTWVTSRWPHTSNKHVLLATGHELPEPPKTGSLELAYIWGAEEIEEELAECQAAGLIQQQILGMKVFGSSSTYPSSSSSCVKVFSHLTGKKTKT